MPSSALITAFTLSESDVLGVSLGVLGVSLGVLSPGLLSSGVSLGVLSPGLLSSGVSLGVHDPKFKRIGRGALSCAIASIVVGVFCVLLTGGI